MGTRSQSTTSATTPSSGSTRTSLPRWTSTLQSRRRSRVCATQSSRSSTELVAEHLGELALIWEAWVEVLPLVLEQLVAREGLDLLSRKPTKSQPETRKLAKLVTP